MGVHVSPHPEPFFHLPPLPISLGCPSALALSALFHESQSEVSQKEKHQYSILIHIYGIYKDGNDDPVCIF